MWHVKRKIDGARLDGAQVIQEKASHAPPEQTEQPEIALRREHAQARDQLLSETERAALIAKLDSKPTNADWALWKRDLDARID